VLLDHLNRLNAESPDSVVKSVRARVLADCLESAAIAGSFFSLSVPTGGGKTLAAMAFALRRAALNPDKFRRIIVVIPYLSIIEQNARVYDSVFGADTIPPMFA
jgi:CRISPR-associated endonuclease/helicase Cas3